MTKLFFYSYRGLFTLLCLIGLIVVMLTSSHFIDHRNLELSDNMKTVVRQVVKQSSYVLAPLINDYETEDDTQRINDVMQHLLEQAWINDISIYQLNGTLIAQAGEMISLRDRINLDEQGLISKQTIQIVEKIDFAKKPVGFIRITINPDILKFDQNHLIYANYMIYMLLILSAFLGFLLGFILAICWKNKK